MGEREGQEDEGGRGKAKVKEGGVMGKKRLR